MGNKKFFVDETVFDKIDNQDSAYFLGLLYADGCNYEDCGVVKIDLIQQDLETLENFKKFLNYNGTIKNYKSETKTINGQKYICQPYCRLSFRSKTVSENLSKLGCTSNKTYNLMFPKEDIVPNYLIKHFIRGYMDGDGGISYWIDNKNTGHKKFNINFCGTSDIIINISKILSDKFNCCPAMFDRYEDRDNNNLQVGICGNNVIRKILDWLYEDSNIKMRRKYDKYLELIEENKRVELDTNLYGSAYPKRKVVRLSDNKIYDSLIDCARDNGFVGASSICTRCKKKNGYSYLE